MKLLELIFEQFAPNEYIVMRALKNGEENGIRAEYVRTVVEAYAFAEKHQEEYHVYYGVCSRKARKPAIEFVGTAYAVWADMDAEEHRPKKELLRTVLRRAILPPSAIIDTGRGYHLYWLLREPSTQLDEVTAANIAVQELLSSDAVSDVTRIMRVDGTLNHKVAPPLPCAVHTLADKRYALQDIKAAAQLPDKVRSKIFSGDARGYKSRSELDWRVVCEMIAHGFTDEGIFTVFRVHRVGKKLAEDGVRYLEHTIKKARENAAKPAVAEKPVPVTATMVEEEDCYWQATNAGLKQLSTFVFHPEVLLQSRSNPDTLLGTIRAAGYSWPGIALSRRCFTRADALIKELPLAAWQWVGSDASVKALLPYLMDKLRAAGLPKREATSAIGFFEGYWLGTSQTLSSDAIASTEDAEVVALPARGERPEVRYKCTELAPDREEIRAFFETVFDINQPDVIWPILGWTAACPYKTRLFEHSVCFPILNLFGTRGSGKTSVITKLIQLLLGYDRARSYDCTTTPFVMLSLLGSTNGVPVAFSEYRYDVKNVAERILHYLLLAYDTGYDARGRPDQTVVDYPLRAPFSVDGEDAIRDAAALERVVQVCMHPEHIVEHGPAFNAFAQLATIDLRVVGTRYIMHSLLDTDVVPLWERAYETCSAVFPQVLPDRVRRNLAVTIFGLQRLWTFSELHGASMPEPTVDLLREVLTESLSNVIVAAAGRGRILVDELVEDVLNEYALQEGVPRFVCSYDGKTNVLWFQLSTVLTWWLVRRKMQNRPLLDSAAVKQQLRERVVNSTGEAQPGQYMLGTMGRTIIGRTYWCYGVDVAAAAEAELDVPTSLQVFRMR